MAETRKPPSEPKPTPAPVAEPVLARASESSDPDVHFALGNLQAARSGGNAQAIAEAEAALAALGFN